MSGLLRLVVLGAGAYFVHAWWQENKNKLRLPVIAPAVPLPAGMSPTGEVTVSVSGRDPSQPELVGFNPKVFVGVKDAAGQKSWIEGEVGA